jgi:hypothetical protein
MTPEPSDDKRLKVWDLASGRELRTQKRTAQSDVIRLLKDPSKAAG